MKILFMLLLSIFVVSCSSTKTYHTYDKNVDEIKLPQSVELPADGSSPIAGEEPISNPTTTISFSGFGSKEFVKNGQTANFIYEGINPENALMIYESTDGGYYLSLHPRNELVQVHFSRLCQTFIVPSPTMTSFTYDNSIRYEQIIWTPRSEGNWEVRIGSTQRGCKSEALDRLNKLRTRDYDREAKSTIIK